MCGERRKPVRIILQVICHLLCVTGLAVGLGGLYLLMQYRQHSLFFSQTYITLPGILALCSAGALLFVSHFGLCISSTNSRCLQGMFVYLVVVVFCLESTTSALAYYHSTKLNSDLAPLSEVFQKYTGSSQDLNSRAVDATQEKFQCCGVSNYTDWREISWLNQTKGILVPHSCCNTSFPSCNATMDEPRQLYPQGCQMKLETAFRFTLSFIIWGLLVVFLIEVILLLIMAHLMKSQQFDDQQPLLAGVQARMF